MAYSSIDSTTFSTDISDATFDATSWDGVTDVAPSKNTVRDKIVQVEGTEYVIQGGII